VLLGALAERPTLAASIGRPSIHDAAIIGRRTSRQATGYTLWPGLQAGRNSMVAMATLPPERCRPESCS